jgi:hypothetical protein
MNWVTTVGEKESTERNESESEIQTYIVINLIFKLFVLIVPS